MPLGAADVADVSVGDEHACLVRDSGQLACWGHNDRGELGLGDMVMRDRPTDVPSMTMVREVAAGAGTTCVLLETGEVRCAGTNHAGQLGDGTRTTRTTFVPVSSPYLYQKVSLGFSYACALRRTTGIVDCWGTSYVGQLGDGKRVSRSVPAPVPGLSGITQLSTGHEHACALDGAGALLCWGQNSDGQIGNGESAETTTPTHVVGTP